MDPNISQGLSSVHDTRFDDADYEPFTHSSRRVASLLHSHLQNRNRYVERVNLLKSRI